MTANLDNLFRRAPLTDADIRILHGVVRALAVKVPGGSDRGPRALPAPTNPLAPPAAAPPKSPAEASMTKPRSIFEDVGGRASRPRRRRLRRGGRPATGAASRSGSRSSSR